MCTGVSDVTLLPLLFILLDPLLLCKHLSRIIFEKLLKICDANSSIRMIY